MISMRTPSASASASSVRPVTMSTPPVGSMSVASTSTSTGRSSLRNAECGTVMGVVSRSGGADTSTRTRPVAVSVPSVTVYSR